MIAADTSVWIDFFRGSDNEAVSFLERALTDGSLVIPAPVLFETLSGPGLTVEAHALVIQLPRLTTDDATWIAAGEMRRKLIEKKLRARAMDCLIARNCIDHDVPLITLDSDFRHFAPFGLLIVPADSRFAEK